MSYQHLLFPGRDYFTIVHVESNCEVGYVRPRDAKYRVQNDYGDDVVLVNSIDEAIPALLDYYEEHPPRWECDSPTGYTRLSQFGLLMVERDHQDGWPIDIAMNATVLCCVTASRRSSLHPWQPSRLPMLTFGMTLRHTPRAFRGTEKAGSFLA